MKLHGGNTIECACMAQSLPCVLLHRTMGATWSWCHDVLPYFPPQLDIGPPHNPILLIAPLHPHAPSPNRHLKGAWCLCCWGWVCMRLQTSVQHKGLGWESCRHVGDMLPRQPNVGTFCQNAPVVATKNWSDTVFLCRGLPTFFPFFLECQRYIQSIPL
jgi:hypothetical protein